MSNSPEIDRLSGGVVTFLDVLGWKGVYDRKRNAIVSLTKLIDGVKLRADASRRGRILNNVDVKSISDTIAIFTYCSESEVVAAIEVHGELCQWLIPASIDAELPVRGATSFGDFELGENIFVGKAIDEAASWHEQGDWIGVNLSPSAEFAFLSAGKSKAWIPYSVPIKGSMKWKPHCVNWVADWTLPKIKMEGVRSAFQSMGPILPEIAPKFINTLTFIENVTSKQKFAEENIVVLVEGRIDAEIVNGITSVLALKRPIFIELANGKNSLRVNLKEYAQTFNASAGIIVLADSDTSDANQIETLKAQFQKIIDGSVRPDTRVIFAVPEISAWLGKTDFNRDRRRDFNKLFEELHYLQTNLDRRAKELPALKEFIDALQFFDSKSGDTGTKEVKS
ncbi:MAG: hypothetical protein WCS31_09485 [Verrucomicrobiae bacterium]